MCFFTIWGLNNYTLDEIVAYLKEERRKAKEC